MTRPVPEVHARRDRRRGGRSPCGCATGTRSTSRSPTSGLERAGGPLHGLRHPVLPQRLPAGQPDPRVERPGLRGTTGATRSSGCTPPTTSPSSPAGCARRRARRPACSASTQDPVTIKQIEVEIIDRALDEGWVVAAAAATCATGKTVAVVGSGPAGLAAAQQLTRAGHAVTVFERDDAPGGLLRYGIPEFKMEKRALDRRLDQMEAEGTEFRCGVSVGVDVAAEQLRAGFDAVVLAGGATGGPRPAGAGPRAGRHPPGDGVPAAGPTARRRTSSADGGADAASPPITAAGKHVVIIGGGDTGADCLGTAHRQGAASVTQLEIMPRPPESRADNQPWPTYPMIYRVSSAHEEGGERVFAVTTEEFLGDAAAACGRCGCVEVAMDGRQVRPGARAPSASSRASWCCWRWASSAPEQPGLLDRPRRRARRRAATSPAMPTYDDLGARRVRRRRHGPRPVADRLGDRRGPQRRGGRRPAPAIPVPPGPAGPDPAHGPPAGLAWCRRRSPRRRPRQLPAPLQPRPARRSRQPPRAAAPARAVGRPPLPAEKAPVGGGGVVRSGTRWRRRSLTEHHHRQRVHILGAAVRQRVRSRRGGGPPARGSLVSAGGCAGSGANGAKLPGRHGSPWK